MRISSYRNEDVKSVAAIRLSLFVIFMFQIGEAVSRAPPVSGSLPYACCAHPGCTGIGCTHSAATGPAVSSLARVTASCRKDCWDWFQSVAWPTAAAGEVTSEFDRSVIISIWNMFNLFVDANSDLWANKIFRKMFLLTQDGKDTSENRTFNLRVEFQ